MAACRTIKPSVHAFGMPKNTVAAACSTLPISMRARRLVYRCIKSGFQGAKLLAGGAGGAAAPCRRPRRAPVFGTKAAFLKAQKTKQLLIEHPPTMRMNLLQYVTF
jgi:hypothetical protein